MGESWFHRELLTPRRLAFNVLFYGAHFALFAYGWWSQVGLVMLIVVHHDSDFVFRQLMLR